MWEALPLKCKSTSWETPVHLHGAGAVGRALSDVEEASGGSMRLATLSAGASTVDDHGFALEQAHQVRRLLALGHSHLGLEVEHGENL